MIALKILATVRNCTCFDMQSGTYESIVQLWIFMKHKNWVKSVLEHHFEDFEVCCVLANVCLNHIPNGSSVVSCLYRFSKDHHPLLDLEHSKFVHSS